MNLSGSMPELPGSRISRLQKNNKEIKKAQTGRLPRSTIRVGRHRLANKRAVRLAIRRRGIRKSKRCRPKSTAVLNDEMALVILESLAAAQSAVPQERVREIKGVRETGLTLRPGGSAGVPQAEKINIGHRMAISFITGCTVSFLGRLAMKYLGN